MITERSEVIVRSLTPHTPRSKSSYPPTMPRHIVLPVILLALTLPVHAQSSEADITTRLLNKPLFLRGLWKNDHLKFDSTGQLQSKSPTTSFTLAGIEIAAIELTPHGIHLRGHRVGIFLSHGPPKRKTLDDEITVEIDPPANRDYTSALDSIFAENISEVVPGLADISIRHSVTPPRVISVPPPIHTVGPELPKGKDIVLVNLWLDETGKPTHVRAPLSRCRPRCEGNRHRPGLPLRSRQTRRQAIRGRNEYRGHLRSSMIAMQSNHPSTTGKQVNASPFTIQ
jgi:hypothetical protein